MNRITIRDYFWIKYLNASRLCVADVYYVLFIIFRSWGDE
jgi:hypothetical protein